MQGIRNAILRHVRPAQTPLAAMAVLRNRACLSAAAGPGDRTMDRVIGLVKKFDKIDASKVTDTADFQKDLSLDSLDRVELDMAFEQEFSVEIPDDEADKLSCCKDVANYLASTAVQKT